jgi:tRNA(Ile)-lysidine synthase
MQLTDADAWVRFHICNGPDWDDVARLGVAVSGGGDSMALLHLLGACAADHGVTLEAATVDHGLRPEAAAEAALVAETCAGLGIRHETLQWQDWRGQGNLQAEARGARYRLLARWAMRRNLDAVALGHTMDDQAETFLMRLVREAGVDGLAAMDRRFRRDGATFWRPALMLERAELRGFLTRHGLAWREDPTNDDAAFDRVKARRALAALAPLGLDVHRLTGVAVNMAAARTALEQTTFETARRIAREQAGDVVIDRDGYLAAPWEIQRRLLASALVWVSGADYAPRRDALGALDAAILRGRTHTLAGCLLVVDKANLRIAREFNAVKDLVAEQDHLWDARWRIEGPGAGLTIRALGEAVKDCPDWRNIGLPRASLMASPSLWDGDRLVAAPVAGLANGYSATIDHPKGDFLTSILSH